MICDATVVVRQVCHNVYFYSHTQHSASLPWTDPQVLSLVVQTTLQSGYRRSAHAWHECPRTEERDGELVHGSPSSKRHVWHFPGLHLVQTTTCVPGVALPWSLRSRLNCVFGTNSLHRASQIPVISVRVRCCTTRNGDDVPEGRGVLFVGGDGPPGGVSDRDGRRAVLSLALDGEVQACLDVAQEPLVLRLLLQNPLWL